MYIVNSELVLTITSNRRTIFTSSMIESFL